MFLPGHPETRSEITGVKYSAFNPSNPACPEPHTPTREVFPLLRVEGRLWNSQTAVQGAGANPQPEASASLGQAGFRFGCRRGFWVVLFPDQVALEARVNRAPGRTQGAVASLAAAVGENQAGRRRR